MGFLDILGGLGGVFSGAAGGMAQGRENEADALIRQDAIRSNQYATQQQAETARAQMLNQMGISQANVDLLRRQFSESAPGTRFKQALLGNLAANLQDSRVGGVGPNVKIPTFSGGLKPSALGAGGRAAGSELARQAMLRLLGGDKFDPIQTHDTRMVTPPQMSQLPKSSFLEKLLGGAGLAGNALKALQSQGMLGGPKPSGAPSGAQPGVPEHVLAKTGVNDPMPAPPGYYSPDGVNLWNTTPSVYDPMFPPSFWSNDPGTTWGFGTQPIPGKEVYDPMTPPW